MHLDMPGSRNDTSRYDIKKEKKTNYYCVITTYLFLFQLHTGKHTAQPFKHKQEHSLSALTLD